LLVGIKSDRSGGAFACKLKAMVHLAASTCKITRTAEAPTPPHTYIYVHLSDKTNEHVLNTRLRHCVTQKPYCLWRARMHMRLDNSIVMTCNSVFSPFQPKGCA